MSRAQKGNKLVNYSKTIEVIEVSVCEGKGTEDNVYRTVIYYFKKDGTLIARIDDWEAQALKEEIG